MVCSIKLGGWERLIDSSFVNTTVCLGTDQELFILQIVFMSTVLDLVLLNPKGMKFIHFYKDKPRTLWTAHESHQSAQISLYKSITILLGDKLTNMKIAHSKLQIAFLQEFNTVLHKFDVVLVDNMPWSPEENCQFRSSTTFALV